MNDLFTNGASASVNVDRIEATARVVRKRELRRRLPSAARQLVSMADTLDDIARDIDSQRRTPWSLAEQARGLAAGIRTALCELADGTSGGDDGDDSEAISMAERAWDTYMYGE